MRNQNKSNIISSKVPQITLFFWIIKVLCTTVGETFSDFLNETLGFGLVNTSIAMGAALTVVLVFQFMADKYIPALYWLTVVLVSVFGTLVTDIGTDQIGIPLEASTIFFTIALMLVFGLWYRSEKTLSIHSIFTRKREAFYWLAILCTFALGTASGDLIAEGLGFGYLTTGIIVCSVIICFSVAWKFGLDAVLSFWVLYIMTRPLGASLGDLLSQPNENGGLGLGTVVTSAIFLAAILLTVIFLSVTKKDLIEKLPASTDGKKSNAVIQVVVVLSVFAIVSCSGYFWRQAVLSNETSAAAQNGGFEDMSKFSTIEEDVLALVEKGDFSGAKTRIKDLETAWDNDAAHLKAIDKDKWTEIDKSIDAALKAVRAANPNADDCKVALEASLELLQ